MEKNFKLNIEVSQKGNVIINDSIERFPFYVGRSEDADLCLSQFAFLSKKHFYIDFDGKEFIICDNESSNGVYQNKKVFKKKAFTEEIEFHIGNIFFKVSNEEKVISYEAEINDTSNSNISLITDDRPLSALDDITARQKKEIEAKPELFKEFTEDTVLKTMNENESFSELEKEVDLPSEPIVSEAESQNIEFSSNDISLQTEESELNKSPEVSENLESSDSNFSGAQILEIDNLKAQDNEADESKTIEKTYSSEKIELSSKLSEDSITEIKLEKAEEEVFDDDVTRMDIDPKLLFNKTEHSPDKIPNPEKPKFDPYLRTDPEITITNARARLQEEYPTEIKIKDLNFTQVDEKNTTFHTVKNAAGAQFATQQINKTEVISTSNENNRKKKKTKNNSIEFILQKYSDRLKPILLPHLLNKKITPHNKLLQISYSKNFVIVDSKLFDRAKIKHKDLHPDLMRYVGIGHTYLKTKCKIYLSEKHKYHYWKNGVYVHNSDFIQNHAQSSENNHKYIFLEKEDALWMEVGVYEYIHFRLSPPTRQLNHRPSNLVKWLHEKESHISKAIYLVLITMIILQFFLHETENFENNMEASRGYIYSIIE